MGILFLLFFAGVLSYILPFIPISTVTGAIAVSVVFGLIVVIREAFHGTVPCLFDNHKWKMVPNPKYNNNTLEQASHQWECERCCKTKPIGD